MSHKERIIDVYRALDALMDHAVLRLGLDGRDIDWTRNAILGMFRLDSYAPTGELAGERDQDALLEAFDNAGMMAGLFRGEDCGDINDAVMGALSASPSRVQDMFLQVERAGDGMAAMQWLYDYGVANTYVRRAGLERNPRFDSHGLVVTINLAKPEFKNMAKAAAGNSVSGGYPLCTICHANEGFAGRAKRTLRTVPVDLGGEPWFWQFSPYGYFNQHGICVNMEHTPMHVDRDTFGKLLDFVERFPGYFLGCNAALPRIGGSVLAHDHYQGGGEMLPMHTAPAWATLCQVANDDVTVEILDWPGTAVRVVSRDRAKLIEVCEQIRQAWVSYTNPELSIWCEGEDGKRSALSPSAIIAERGYEMSLIFRNNGVNETYPDGIFHAHPEFYPIKQEPIGLIEAQGLFILPGRLVNQLAHLEDALVAGEPLPRSEQEFGLIWNELLAALRGNREREAVRAAIRDELGSVCERILRNTAVFPTHGHALDFMQALGWNPTDSQ